MPIRAAYARARARVIVFRVATKCGAATGRISQHQPKKKTQAALFDAVSRNSLKINGILH
jgi:hypothetical protein